MIAGYLGERPALSVKKWTLRRVPIDTSADWHQDGAFLGSGIRTINMWLSLSQCGADAPGLDIVPSASGPHRRDRHKGLNSPGRSGRNSSSVLPATPVSRARLRAR